MKLVAQCVRLGVTLAVLGLTLSCSSASRHPDPVTTPSSTAPTSTPDQAVSTPSVADPDLLQSEAAVGRFWRVVDRLSADPFTKLEALATVSRGAVNAQWHANITSYRQRQWKQTGRVSVVGPSAVRSPKSGQYSVSACIDVSKTDLVDKTGKSVVDKSGLSRVMYRYTVQQDAGRWYVVGERATSTC
jgi:hypothetical protein